MEQLWLYYRQLLEPMMEELIEQLGTMEADVEQLPQLTYGWVARLGCLGRLLMLAVLKRLQDYHGWPKFSRHCGYCVARMPSIVGADRWGSL